MAKFNQATIKRWQGLAEQWLRSADDPGTVHDIKLGAEAWTIAHRCNIVNEAYADPTVVDAHIKTALTQIFPNAEFRDSYRY